MASCIELTSNLKKEILDSFISDLKNPNENSWFIAFGNPISWETIELEKLKSGFVYNETVLGEDTNVPLIKMNDDEKYEFYRTCIAMKKISRNDVSFLIPRNEWQQNKTYFPYRQEENMFEDQSKTFYVFNSDNRCVYKCIENKSGLSGESLSSDLTPASKNKPSSTNLEIFDTGDGYKWKLIYQISSADLLNYSVEGRSEEDSYIPVRYIDFDPEPSETELLRHKSVQDNAIRGQISSVYINDLYTGLFTYDTRYTVIGSESAIYPVNDYPTGATTIVVDYFGSNSNANSLKDMLFYVISGPGSGQTRIIKSSSRSKGIGYEQLTLVVDPLDEGISAFSVSEEKSALNIIPALKIIGDGEARSPTASGNSYLDSALGLLNFSTEIGNFLTGVDLVDTGKNYTFARAFCPKGLTASQRGGTIPDDLFSISLSPPNGHGSNAVAELGASKILIKTTFEGSENGRIEAINDFRQIGLIKNPILSDKIALVRTTDGVGSGITTGDAVTITGTSNTVQGTVIKTTAFEENLGHEYLINGLSGTIGDFDYISGVPIDPDDGFELIEIAGLENKENLILKATSTISSSIDPRNIVIGVGNKSTGLKPSYASGKVVRIDVDEVYINSISGTFKENEIVYALGRDGTYSNSFTIEEIKVPTYQNYRDSYSMITEITLKSQANELFETFTFQEDQIIYSFPDSTKTQITSATEYKSAAYCFDWKANLSPVVSLPGDPSYNTGTLKLIGANPDKFQVGDYILYYKKSKTTPLYAQINSITKPEISYGSGEILYIQNFPGIERNYQTDEEINLVIGI